MVISQSYPQLHIQVMNGWWCIIKRGWWWLVMVEMIASDGYRGTKDRDSGECDNAWHWLTMTTRFMDGFPRQGENMEDTLQETLIFSKHFSSDSNWGVSEHTCLPWLCLQNLWCSYLDEHPHCLWLISNHNCKGHNPPSRLYYGHLPANPGHIPAYSPTR